MNFHSIAPRIREIATIRAIGISNHVIVENKP